MEREKERLKEALNTSSKSLDREINLKKSLDIAVKSLQAKTNELKNRKLNSETRLSELINEITNSDKSIQSVTNEIKNTKKDLKELNTKISNLNSGLKKLEETNEKDKKNHKDKNESIQKINDNINCKKLKATEINEKKENLQLTSIQLQDKKNGLLVEKHVMAEELVKTNDVINETKAEIENLNGNISKTEKELNEKKSLLEEKSKTLEKLNEKKSILEIKAKGHENSLKKIDVNIKSENENKIDLEKRDTEFVTILTELRNLKSTTRNNELRYQNDVLNIGEKEAQTKVEIEKFKNDVEVNIDDNLNAIIENHKLVREKDDYKNKLKRIEDRKNFINTEIDRFKFYKSDCQQIINKSNIEIEELDLKNSKLNEKFTIASKLSRNANRDVTNHQIINNNNINENNNENHYNR